jgi:EmrB/QacA subfamily drug resistance transporter
MYGLDTTIVATALPSIARTFDASPVSLSVAITAYIVSLAVFIPVSGWLSDRFGAKAVLIAAIGIFTASSVLCGLSGDVIEFTVMRMLQGIGGAMMIPVGRLVILRSVQKSQYVRAMMTVLIPAQVGPLLGPVVGGFITTFISWRWIFLINAPIGALGMLLTAISIKNYKEDDCPPFDGIGFALSSACVFCFTAGLQTPGSGLVGWRWTTALLLASLALGCLLIFHSRRAFRPLIDLSLMSVQTFNVNISSGSFFRLGFATTPFMLPLEFQIVFHMTAFSSGLLTFISALGSIGSRVTLSFLLKRFGYRTVMVQNAVFYALTVAACAMFVPSTPNWLMLIVIFACGVSRMLQNNSFNTLAYADIVPQKMSAAAGLAQLSQQLGQMLGVAISALILQILMCTFKEARLSLADFQITFLIVAALSFLSLPGLLRLAKDAGQEVSGHKNAGRSIVDVEGP